MTIKIDRLFRSRRRTIALIIEDNGSVTVRAPLHAPDTLIQQFVDSKTGWVEQKRKQAQDQQSLKKKFVQGETFLFLGHSYPLRFVDRQRPVLALDADFSLSRNAIPRAELAFERWYRAQAAQMIGERTQAYAHQFGLRYQRLRISSARTRWGSCSSSGTLSFTWRLIKAPLEVVDYVIIHELAHLKVRNHSKQFWAEVEKMLPTYKKHRDWLKKNGKFLM
jgi:predicted metal-dependent hydrolase